jgi:hypothetical protein
MDQNSVDYRLRPLDYRSVQYLVAPHIRYGNRSLTEVTFPSSKVLKFEQYGRHSQKQFDYRTYYGFDTSKCVVLFFDSSVSLRASKDANNGNAQPRIPDNLTSTVPYDADGQTPDPAPPSGPMPSHVRFLFTRGGLKGVDFGGGEVFTTAY